ncbi:cell division protein ZapA [Neptuniibacter sp. CAU 1671]|uniref:cell division protein ZapA n=1 Tax=Neptuniibacter sp. CAU 1671 TaxID=3032593 RepID=UPI0023DB358F|nr:cell division protein ZapA [Neptuniibacter sp. CAU 1671]MDF2182644.1 cell division protein ZapA [Neptuniibacter sp. CAU 1671]
MTPSGSQAVTIKLLGKEYSINCPADAEAELLTSAVLLNEKMQEIRKTGKVLGLERIAIMAALNLAHELLQSKQNVNSDIETRLKVMGQKVDKALQHLDQN